MSSTLQEQIKLGLPQKQGLYDPAFEKDSCGVGFVAHIKGEPSHQIVLDADHMLQRMEHRGGCGCEANTGDGAGILTGMPHEFMVKVARNDLGEVLPGVGRYAAGNVFFPQDEKQRAYCKQNVEKIIEEQGQHLIGWRELPVDTDGADVGPTARNSQPHMEQLFIAAADDLADSDFERQLYLIRKRSTNVLRTDENLSQRTLFYICSLSPRIIIYKGMLNALQVKAFFPDLLDEDYKT
ncbi:MAG: glutamate synthase subunit alpha, partial [Gammaproteobacteria bacterium]|nr:glutamate synthase subunit alpha [Gammaproteobacteria bacterium]